MLEILPEEITPVDRTVRSRLWGKSKAFVKLPKPAPTSSELELQRLQIKRLEAEIKLEELLAKYRAEQKTLRENILIPSIGKIMETTATYYNIPYYTLWSKKRTGILPRIRQVAMYLAKHMTPKSLPEIARRMDDRDHTTILYGERKIAALIVADPEIREQVEQIKELLKPLVDPNQLVMDLQPAKHD